MSFNANLVIDSPYNGEPSVRVDHAWTELLQCKGLRAFESFNADEEDMNIAISKSDLDKIGAESIKVPNRDDQYIAGLGVYHELHCLVSTASHSWVLMLIEQKRLRQYTWKEYYHSNATEEENKLNRLHTGKIIYPPLALTLTSKITVSTSSAKQFCAVPISPSSQWNGQRQKQCQEQTSRMIIRA